MKKKKTTFEKKLKAYSAVAAGTLLLAPSANAAVQYSGLQNLPVINPLGGPNISQRIDLNGDGIDDFKFVARSTGWIFSSVEYIGIWPHTSGDIGGKGWVDSINSGMPANLPSNYLIQDRLANSSVNTWYSVFDYIIFEASIYTGGNFIEQSGYIGVRFNSAGCHAPDYLLGWIQFEGISFREGTIIDWAYEEKCNTPIFAGAIEGGPLLSIPVLNQWGLFVLIALLAGAGVRVLRKKEEV